MRKHLKKCLWVGFSLLLLLTFALPSHASYQCLRLDGSGWAEIADADQAGLNMGLSDFMLEARVKVTDTGAIAGIVSKYSETGYYLGYDATGEIRGKVRDATTNQAVYGYVNIFDGRWHYVALVADRSNAAAGLRLYFDDSFVGSGQLGTATCDTSADFKIGDVIDLRMEGQIDSVRIWNFGKDGLPADYADYIAWRVQGRNVFKDISEYDEGSWNCYADADRTELLTDPGIENWTDDTPDDWTEEGESAGVRDILREDAQVHSGSHAAKLEITGSDGTDLRVKQIIGILEQNKYYKLSGWVYHPTRTVGDVYILLWNATDLELVKEGPRTSINAEYTYYEGVCKPTSSTYSTVMLVFRFETTTGIAYFDDISVKRVGLVARWRFEGDYTDEGSNNNHLTEGGVGNTMPGYTLKRTKIISPAWVR